MSSVATSPMLFRRVSVATKKSSTKSAKKSTKKSVEVTSSKKSKPKKRKKTAASSTERLRIVEILVVVLIVAFLTGWLLLKSYRNFETRAILKADVPWSLHIPRGGTVWGTWRNLVRDDAVEASRWFAVWVAFNRVDCLQAGVHTIAPNQNIEAMFQTLCQPTQGSGQRVVLPEGLNMWSIADRLQAARVTSRSAFIEQASQPLSIRLYDLETPTAEGFLFPDTWEFEEGTPANELVDKMTARFVKIWKQLNEQHPTGLATIRERWGLGMYEVIIVASIVEKEAMVDAERPLIARVIYNRIEKGMRIQCDPTCVYGEDRYREKPSPAFCKTDANAWSTYAHDGLPPTPIANPGKASLAAALSPADDARVLYFVAKNDGSHRHVFSSTLQEHNQNVRRYLRK